jgi:hypothetical protein
MIGMYADPSEKDMADPDTTLPTLTGFTFPTTVDVTGGGKAVSLSASATDVGTGVDYVYLYLDHEYQDQYGLSKSLLFNNSTDSFADGTSNLSQYFDATTPAGTYGIAFASVYDKAGNVTQYSPEQLSSLGLATSFEVVSNLHADWTLPTLTGLTFPTTIDVTGGGTAVSLSVGATDVGTGIDYVYFYLDHGYQNQYGFSQSLLFDDSTDSFADGTSNLSQYFDVTTQAGTYGIAFASVYDKAGNVTQYSPDQLSSLGFATSFQVVNRNATAAKTVQNDFNGDGRSDIVWRNDNGALTDWLGQAGGGFALNDTAAYAQVPLAWKVAGVGDFNGDGRSDIVWRNDNGALTDWLGQANGGFAINDTAAYAQVSLDWKVAGVGDFNGDGHSDVLWRNDDGALTDWLGQANGGFAINNAAYTTALTTWKVAGVGDFNGDGRDDVLWRNDDGALTDWLGQENGGFALNDAAAYTTAPTSWRVAGVGDFDGDGRDDVLWRNDNGALTDWLGQADGGFAINNAAYTEAPTAWKVANVGDYNGDGRDDILWRNDNGALTDWLGQANGGFALNDPAAFTTAPNAWKIADTHPLLGAAATNSADHGLTALHQAFAPEHVTADNLAMGYFASSRLDQNVSVMESIW